VYITNVGYSLQRHLQQLQRFRVIFDDKNPLSLLNFFVAHGFTYLFVHFSCIYQRQSENECAAVAW